MARPTEAHLVTLIAQQATQAEAIATLRAELGAFCDDQRQQNSDLARAITRLATAIAAQSRAEAGGLSRGPGR